MNREEAIDIIRKNIPHLGIGAAEMTEALNELIPELRESDDERIRKHLIAIVELYWGKTNDPDKAKELAYLEKQKDASKAIEAVDRIDKYIDEHLANAHDMKDSNPDKKYYRGWDDALGKMAGILQDVYSEKENKFAPRVLPCSAAWFEDGDEKQKEPEKPINPEDAMKELNEKIALVKQRGTWDGVDVDKYMDEVRGREPEKPMHQEGLEVASVELADMLLAKQKDYAISAKADYWNGAHDGVIAGAKWQAEQDTRDMLMSDNRHFNKVYELGKKDMKEQMMKEAMAVQVVGEQRDLRLIDSTQRCLFNAKRGDWLEIIIVKED